MSVNYNLFGLYSNSIISLPKICRKMNSSNDIINKRRQAVEKLFFAGNRVATILLFLGYLEV